MGAHRLGYPSTCSQGNGRCRFLWGRNRCVIHFSVDTPSSSWLACPLCGNRSYQSQERVIHVSNTHCCLHLVYILLILPNASLHEAGDNWILFGTIAGAVTIAVVMLNTWDWNAISRSMLAFASGLIVMGLGHWAQLASTPWAQGNDTMPKDHDIVIPLLVVVGIPLAITYFVWKIGEEDLHQLRLTGYEVGVIPDCMTVDEWESEDRSAHPVEMLSPKGILATPLVAGMLFGQLCDGLATMVGIDWYGYSEKHPVSDAVIQFGNGFDILGEGAWLFFIVKAIIVGLIVWMFTEMRVESRQQHLRVLIVLGVMIVGMAPGLRDIGRLILGV